MDVQWFDRTNVKNNFSLWLEQSNPFMFVHVFDIQEMRDINKWMVQSATPLFPISIGYPSDYPIIKNELLEEVAQKLGGEDKFPEFFKEFNRPFDEYISIRQGVAEDATSGGALEASSIIQQAVIQVSSIPSLGQLREHDIGRLFDLFLSDFKESFSLQQILFIFQFKKQGFQAFTPDFKRWFYKFCEQLSQGGCTKFCILNQGYSDELHDIDTEYIETVSEDLLFDDIFIETESIDFCCGVVDAKTNCVKYSHLKRQLALLEKKKNPNG